MKIERRISLLKSSAKKRGIEVRLMKHEFENLIKMGCQYCKRELSNDGGVCLDRIDSDRGYVLDNVTPCCKRCNVAKNDMTITEFVNWVERVYVHMQKMINMVSEMEPCTYQDEKKLHSVVNNNKKVFVKV